MFTYQSVRRAAAVAVVGGAVAGISLSATTGSALASGSHSGKASTASTQPVKHPALNLGSPTSLPNSTKAESVVANYSGGGLLNVQFSAQLASGQPETHATGTFKAELALGSHTVGTLAGPVTCLSINGPDIGIFYPVTSSSPAALGSVMKGVYVSVELGAQGQPVSFSFRPSLIASDSHCDPLPGLIPITSGTVSFGS